MQQIESSLASIASAGETFTQVSGLDYVKVNLNLGHNNAKPSADRATVFLSFDRLVIFPSSFPNQAKHILVPLVSIEEDRFSEPTFGSTVVDIAFIVPDNCVYENGQLGSRRAGCQLMFASVIKAIEFYVSLLTNIYEARIGGYTVTAPAPLSARATPQDFGGFEIETEGSLEDDLIMQQVRDALNVERLQATYSTLMTFRDRMRVYGLAQK